MVVKGAGAGDFLGPVDLERRLGEGRRWGEGGRGGECTQTILPDDRPFCICSPYGKQTSWINMLR